MSNTSKMAQCRATVTISMVHFFQTPSASSLVAVFGHHRRIVDEYYGCAAVTKFPTKYFRIELCVESLFCEYCNRYSTRNLVPTLNRHDSHLSLRSRLDLASWHQNDLKVDYSYHLMTRLEVFVT